MMPIWVGIILTIIGLIIGFCIASDTNLNYMWIGTITYKDVTYGGEDIGYRFYFTVTYDAGISGPTTVRYQVTKGLYYSLEVGQPIPIITRAYIRDSFTKEKES